MTDCNEVSLFIYNEFTEISKEISADPNFKIIFPEEEYFQILDNSLESESDDVLVQKITRKAINLEGKTVFVKKNEKEAPRKAILVRGSDNLVRDDETNRFYNVLSSQIEYEEAPEMSLYEANFTFAHPLQTTLNYQIKTISWLPKYTLKLYNNGEVMCFKCTAIIKNTSKTQYLVKKAELFGGQVSTNAPQCGIWINESNTRFADAPECDFANTDLGGIYQYALKNEFCLEADSQVYIEFIRPCVDVSEFSELHEQNPGEFSKSMNRSYMIKSDTFLPSGHLTIRQNKRLIGNSSLTNLPAEEKREIQSGVDSSSFVQRKISKHSTQESQITLVFRNNHPKLRKFRYKETHEEWNSDFKFEIDDDHIRHIDNGIQINGEIPSGENFQIQFCIIKHVISKK